MTAPPHPTAGVRAARTGIPVAWDPVRLRDELVTWLSSVIPAGLEIGLTDHGHGIGVVRDGRLVVGRDGRGHYALIGAVEGPEPMAHIAGRVEQTLRHVGAAVSAATGQAWPRQAGPEAAEAFALPGDRALRCGWAHHVDRASGEVEQVVLGLPDLAVHPPPPSL